MTTITNSTPVIDSPEYEQAWADYKTIRTKMDEASSKVNDAYRRGVKDLKVLASYESEFKQWRKKEKEAMEVIQVMLGNITPEAPSSNVLDLRVRVRTAVD